MSDLYPTPLAAAQMYAVMGWRVAPVTPGKKVPAIAEWQRRASTDEGVITHWWRDSPSAGVCIVTGRETGLWVLDVDVADGKQGLETLRAVVAEHGPLGETLVARTPSGGYHYYFAYPDDVEIHNSASNRLGAGLDVRGEGGQVNAAPTKRGDAAYRWADGRAPWAAEVQPAPAWLVELVKDQPRPVGKATEADGSSVGIPTHSPTAALAIRSQQDLLDGVPTFVTDYNASTSWEELLTSAGWEPCQTQGDIDYWARLGKSCREGISASTNYAGSDLLYVWSTSVEGLPSDRAYDRYGYMVHRDFGGDFDAAARHFVAERRETAGVGERIDPADLLADQAVKTPETSAQDDVSRIEQAEMPIGSAEFWNAEQQDRQFLIEPFLGVGRAHALFAEAKAGKSYVVLQALAAASVPGHTSWAEVPDQPITILYLDYEMTDDDLRERLEIFGYSQQDDYSRLHYVKASMLGADLDTHDGGLELLHQAKKWGCDLVVIDTMSRAVSGEENDADTVRKFYQHTGRLLKANGIAWLRIDHAGKNTERGQRGSSGKNDDVDAVWKLERTETGAKLSLTHTRVFWMDQTIALSNVVDEEGGIRHIRSTEAGYPAGVYEKVQEWKKLGIPEDASRVQARNLGFKCRSNIFSHVRRAVQADATVDLMPAVRNTPGTAEPNG